MQLDPRTWDATKSILAGLGVRAVDNSNVVPLRYVDRVLALAKENGIPAQYGVTGGANDGRIKKAYHMRRPPPKDRSNYAGHFLSPVPARGPDIAAARRLGI